ncbi:MAG: NADH-quinone oxidoreductase subunit NuoG [Desulfobaccales bacterium]
MPKLIIDHREIEVPPGTTVIAAAERLGIMIPRFCYHPALGSSGACRMCAVKFLEGPVKGVEMSCMTEAKDGMEVSTTDPEAMEFRRYVIEWLMLNHPHDCPVCDEGGHCLLQEETISGGHGLRRYLGKKRTYADQYLGVFVQHEMNRCIHCWRCRNFYQGFAGYRDYGAMQIGNRMYFGRFRDGPLASPFAGNIIDLCPTGVLTDKPARFKGRRWDFERGPSICLHCSLGCNTTGSARYREVMRQEGRFNEKVNGYFLCDRGRFGFHYESRPERPRRARVDGQEVSLPEAVQAAAARLAHISSRVGPEAVACWGSTRSSLETQAELLRLTRGQGGPAPLFFNDSVQARKVKRAVARLDAGLAVSMREIEEADFILTVGADPVNEAPMLALALRQAWRRGAKVAVLDPRPVFLPLEFQHLPVPPGEINRCLRILLKGALSGAAAQGLLEPGAAHFYDSLASVDDQDPLLQDRLVALGQALQQSKRPVIVCGTDIVRAATPDLAADFALLLQTVGMQAGLFYLLPGPNAFGAALLAGMRGAGGQPVAQAFQPGPASAASSGPPLHPLVEAMERGEVKALILVENDPFWHFPDRDRLVRALERLELLVTLDYLPSPAAARAQVLLPTTTLFEGQGSSFVNQEGRLQWAPPLHHGGAPLAQVSRGSHPPRVFLDYVPGGEPRPGGEILRDLAAALNPGKEAPAADLWTWLTEQNPVFARASDLPAQPQGLRLLPEAGGPPVFSPEEINLGADVVLDGHLELLLADRTFGTEELASYSPYIQKAEEKPRLLLRSGDEAQLRLAAGEQVALRLLGGSLTLELEAAENMAPGVMILPRHRQLAWQKLPAGPVLVPANAIEKA